jgi:beta-N-acetylhexosaminidase
MSRSLLTALLFGAFVLPAGVPAGRTIPPSDRADELLAVMTPEERVGQLFLIGFNGSQLEPAVVNLIQRGYVSGVILRAAEDNFTTGPEAPAKTEALIDEMQQERLASSSAAATPLPGEETGGPPYVPLFIAISLNREGSPYPEMLDGFSEPVTPMALGATWDPSLARSVGAQTGRELSALGFNLVLGPSMDVLEEASQGSPGDLGVEGFGGDPYWVSELGQAYVEAPLREWRT